MILGSLIYVGGDRARFYSLDEIVDHHSIKSLVICQQTKLRDSTVIDISRLPAMPSLTHFQSDCMIRGLDIVAKTSPLLRRIHAHIVAPFTWPDSKGWWHGGASYELEHTPHRDLNEEDLLLKHAAIQRHFYPRAEFFMSSPGRYDFTKCALGLSGLSHRVYNM